MSSPRSHNYKYTHPGFFNFLIFKIERFFGVPPEPVPYELSRREEIYRASQDFILKVRAEEDKKKILI